MTDSSEFSVLINQARDGDAAAFERLVTEYRPFLRMLAQRKIDARLQARVDASDIVQQTCFEAHRDLTAFRGEHQGEWIAWVRRILEHNVAEAREKHLLAAKRSARREADLDDGSGPRWEAGVPGEASSPSRRAMLGEEAVQLAFAMDSLPDDQCEAIRLRYLEGFSLAQLAAHFDRSETAVAGLLKRGLRKLRERLV